MKKLKLLHIVLFSFLGTLMFVSKYIMEPFPNIHLLALFIISYTIVFRGYAIIPIYIFVFLIGISCGFAVWWVPYLYIWTVLWGITMLLPKNMSVKIAAPVYMITAAFHGIIYGALYAPFQALAFGLDFKGMITWIISGFPFDAIHAVSNFFVASLTIPIVNALQKALKITH